MSSTLIPMHRCQDLVEARAPNGFAVLHDVVSQEELEQVAGDYNRTAGFDVDGLNSRPSLSVRSPSARASGVAAQRL